MSQLVRSFLFKPRFAQLNTMAGNIRDMRVKYRSKTDPFLETDIAVKEPFDLFSKWFAEIKENPSIIEPNAMCLATASKDGRPSCRYVLCKGCDKDGFQFFTHYDSRKGAELAENPNAALCFYWDVVNRSVRIEGKVEKLPIDQADSYFHARPFDSQVGACLATQSSPIPNRDYLVQQEQKLRSSCEASGLVPRPELWGGYVLKPTMFEFWQGQTNRVHDRIRFRRANGQEKADGLLLHNGEDGWLYERLGP